MKIREGYMLDTIGEQKIAVSLNYIKGQFSGMIKLNPVGAFIWERLLEDTTEEEIVAAVKEKYEVDDHIVRKDVQIFLRKLKDNGMLEL